MSQKAWLISLQDVRVAWLDQHRPPVAVQHRGPTADPEHAGDLGGRARRLREVLPDPLAVHDVDRRVGERQRVRVPVDERRRRRQAGGTFLRDPAQPGVRLDPDGSTGRTPRAAPGPGPPPRRRCRCRPPSPPAAGASLSIAQSRSRWKAGRDSWASSTKTSALRSSAGSSVSWSVRKAPCSRSSGGGRSGTCAVICSASSEPRGLSRTIRATFSDPPVFHHSSRL